MFIVFLIIVSLAEEVFRAGYVRSAGALVVGFAVFYLVDRYIDTKEA